MQTNAGAKIDETRTRKGSNSGWALYNGCSSSCISAATARASGAGGGSCWHLWPSTASWTKCPQVNDDLVALIVGSG
ncbi:hypothetical protein ON010_g18330 [Phytophthora cinnamomi]|nr:hypothetical protein ON010_g18330 [Phytophthora cinnamomi]